MKALSYNLICGYCGHRNFRMVPITSEEGLSSDCDNCGAYLITFEMIDYKEEEKK